MSYMEGVEALSPPRHMPVEVELDLLDQAPRKGGLLHPDLRPEPAVVTADLSRREMMAEVNTRLADVDWSAVYDADAALQASVTDIATRRAGRAERKSSKKPYKKQFKRTVKPLLKKLEAQQEAGDTDGMEATRAEIVAAEADIMRAEFVGLAPTRATPIRNKLAKKVRKQFKKKVNATYKGSPTPEDKGALLAEIDAAAQTLRTTTADQYKAWFVQSLAAQADFDVAERHGSNNTKGAKGASTAKRTLPKKARHDDGGTGGWHPVVCDFLDAIDHPKFKATNYPNHSFGPLSVDFYLNFKDPDNVVAFFLAVEKAASATNCRWQALYNSFEVADAVNAQLGSNKVGFQWGHDTDGPLGHIHMDVFPK